MNAGICGTCGDYLTEDGDGALSCGLCDTPIRLLDVTGPKTVTEVYLEGRELPFVVEATPMCLGTVNSTMIAIYHHGGTEIEDMDLWTEIFTAYRA